MAAVVEHDVGCPAILFKIVDFPLQALRDRVRRGLAPVAWSWRSIKPASFPAVVRCSSTWAGARQRADGKSEPAGCVIWASVSLVRASSSLMRLGAVRARLGWLQEWLPIRCPAAAMRRTSAGSACGNRPTRKKVARTSCVARMSSRRGVQAGLGPSSKVRASSPARARRNERRAKELRRGPHGSIGEAARRQPTAASRAESRVDRLWPMEKALLPTSVRRGGGATASCQIRA